MERPGHAAGARPPAQLALGFTRVVFSTAGQPRRPGSRGPRGPQSIVAADDVGVSNLRIGVRANGEAWCEGNFGNMHQTFADLIFYASQAQTIHPGEVCGSGSTAGASGLEMDRWLKEGDVVEPEVEGTRIPSNRIGKKGK